MFLKHSRQSNFVYDPTNEENILKLLRASDLVKWYYSAFKRSYCIMNTHIIVKDAKQLDRCINDLEKKTFRGHTIISLDGEFINYKNKSYQNYPESEKMFTASPKFPTHRDYPFAIVRWILIGSPFGDIRRKSRQKCGTSSTNFFTMKKR